MVARVLITALMLLLAFAAFWGNALDAGYVLNPFGILFLFLSGIIWFNWASVRDGFISAKDESNIPIIRLGSAIIAGLRRPPAQHHVSSNNSRSS
jgi:uncharacterized membrane protein YbhN (UPF0104 family)